MNIIYAIVFPYLFAVPHNLQVLAGAKWAGKIFLYVLQENNFLVVTGSTDGIGKGYAFELAKKGFNLVLISRTAEKLSVVANEIKEKYASVEVKTIAFDFTNANLKDYESVIFNDLNQLEIGVLGI